MWNYIKIARPDHWVKNAFIIPGIVLGVLLTENVLRMGDVGKTLLGFLATCLISSANYVINEWLDAEFDKYHPVKKNRPVVTQHMKGGIVAAEYLGFAALGLLLSGLLNKEFLLAQLSLLFMGILYNVKPIRTKDIVYIDVLSESVNNMIRLLLGWFIIVPDRFPPSSVLVGYWMAGAFLMGTKRLAEYRMIGDPETAGRYRRSFRYYTEKTLLGSSFFYAMSATFSLGIFMVKYRLEYILSMPFLFWLFAYYLTLAFEEDSVVQKPEKLYKEKRLLLIVAVFTLSLIVLSFIDLPMLNPFHDPYLIELGLGYE